MKENSIVVGIVVLLLGVGGVLFVVSGNSASSLPQQDNTPIVDNGTLALAQCLKDSGTIFYGAFWCPHCKAQKALFGDAVKVLPYVECSTPDGNGQTQICMSKGIKSYPTWVFPDGSQLTGEVPLATLAEKSNCAQTNGEEASTTAESTTTATEVVPM